MELQSITLNGFRRFKEPTELRTNGKLVALLGPNEAGKSSILKAISVIGSSQAIDSADLSRGKSKDEGRIVISARFFLEDADLKAAKIKGPSWYILDKKADGSQSYQFEPSVKKRETSHRGALIFDLNKIRSNNKLWGRIAQKNDEIISDFQLIEGILASSEETLSKNQIGALEEFCGTIDTLIDKNDPKYFRELKEKIEKAVSLEQLETPKEFARKVAYSRLPKILFFSNQDRMLEGRYNLAELTADIPSALDNLAKIAKLDIKKLVDAYQEDDTPELTRLKTLANQELQKKFDEHWSQSGVHVAFEIRNDQLEILVQEPDANFTRLAERSDGLRQFVALQAFTTCERAEDPVLLIDEAEIRLHYDAQADLIQMLTKQTVSPKIIYTTHSAGCLPEDLGNGVRLVSYDDTADGEARSKVTNNFWSRETGGLEPLLFGMGATTLAFFPIRKALLTEGESDMLLLPTMFREVLLTDSLEFQVVPGISKTSGVNLPILARNGAGVAFALDYDEGGRSLFKQIETAGFDKKSIFHLRLAKNKDCQLEDFIHIEILTSAVNSAFLKIKNGSPKITQTQLKHGNRMDIIKRHFINHKDDYIPKVLIAYEILDYVIKNPSMSIIDQSKKASFAKFAHEIVAYLRE